MAKRPRRAAVSEAPALRLHLEHEEEQAPPFTIAVPLPSDPNAPNAARLEALVALVEVMRPREPWQRTLWSAAGILETELHRHVGARAIRTAPRTPEDRARRAAVARSAKHLTALRRELERWPTSESEREAALAISPGSSGGRRALRRGRRARMAGRVSRLPALPPCAAG